MGVALLMMILVVVTAMIFDYINGFHDAANAIATVVSTGVLPIRTAVLIAAISSAARGVSARVETEVAIALAASWKPFV